MTDRRKGKTSPGWSTSWSIGWRGGLPTAPWGFAIANFPLRIGPAPLVSEVNAIAWTRPFETVRSHEFDDLGECSRSLRDQVYRNPPLMRGFSWRRSGKF